jgi:hypothetical protein
VALVALNLQYVFNLTDPVYGQFTDAITVPYASVQGQTQAQILTTLIPQAAARFAAWRNLLANPPAPVVVSIAAQVANVEAQIAADEADIFAQQEILAALGGPPAVGS